MRPSRPVPVTAEALMPVPAGVDPAYDAQYADHKGPVAHVGAHGVGRPFSVAPGPITHTQ